MLVSENKIPISSKPELLKTCLLKYGKAIIKVDKLDNDYTRTCKLEELIVVEPSSPKISAARRYVIGIGDRLLYCRAKQKRDKSVIYILGIGEVKISDLIIWCNAKKLNKRNY